MMPIDVRALEIFRAIADTGSATRAAERLHTTQPSVTRTILAFEAACGFRLFDRSRYGMALTEQGRVLLASVERNFAGLRTIQRTIRELKAGIHGALTATAIPVLAEAEFGALVGSFMADNPFVRIDLRVAAPDLVLRDILTGEVDLGAVIGPAPPGIDLATIPVGRRTMAIAVAPGHELAARRRVHFRELDGRAFVLTVRSHNSSAAVEAMMSEFRVQPSIVHEAGTQRTAAELVRNSDAIGFLDREIIATLPPGSVATVDLDPPVGWPINLLYRRDRKPSPVFAALLRWLEAHRVEEAEAETETEAAA
jgi:DNA-binding transcriptional LysR family regulator